MEIFSAHNMNTINTMDDWNEQLIQIFYEIDGCAFYLQTSKEYPQEYDMRRGSEYSRFHGYTYDGVWTAALAIQEVARKVHQSSHDKGILNRTIADFQYRDKEWEDLFLDALTKTSFEGVTVINYIMRNMCEFTVYSVIDFKYLIYIRVQWDFTTTKEKPAYYWNNFKVIISKIVSIILLHQKILIFNVLKK